MGAPPPSKPSSDSKKVWVKVTMNDNSFLPDDLREQIRQVLIKYGKDDSSPEGTTVNALRFDMTEEGYSIWYDSANDHEEKKRGKYITAYNNQRGAVADAIKARAHVNQWEGIGYGTPEKSLKHFLGGDEPGRPD